MTRPANSGGMTSILPTGGSAAGGHLDAIRTALGSDRAIGAKCAPGWSFSGRSVEGRAARGDHRRGRGAGGGRASSPEPRRAGPLAGSSRGTRPRSGASGCRPLRQQRPIHATRGSARRCGCRVAARGLSSFHVCDSVAMVPICWEVFVSQETSLRDAAAPFADRGRFSS